MTPNAAELHLEKQNSGISGGQKQKNAKQSGGGGGCGGQRMSCPLNTTNTGDAVEHQRLKALMSKVVSGKADGQLGDLF